MRVHFTRLNIGLVREYSSPFKISNSTKNWFKIFFSFYVDSFCSSNKLCLWYGYAAAAHSALVIENWAVDFASRHVRLLDKAVDQLFPFDSSPVLSLSL